MELMQKGELENTGQEIKELKLRLNSINKKKEEAFSKSQGTKKQLLELIRKIRGIKSEKEGVNVALEKLKEDRDKHNKQVKQLISDIKKLNQEKKNFPRGAGFEKDFSKIKKTIDALELKIETEALSPEEEKKTMKKMKGLKKEYGSAGETILLVETANQLSKKIEEEKQLADKSHNELVSKRKGSKDYSEFKEISKEITGLRLKQEKEFQGFLGFKKESQAISKELKEKIGRLTDIKKRERDLSKKREIRKKLNNQKILKEKTRQVEEKFKIKKKLTTEDLIILQGK
ncbi:MAG: hypothetical protein KKG60_02610 [Nanoarchaeota archaeon]|nr:hypothetical protein [Nanoarchaeota archaeon]